MYLVIKIAAMLISLVGFAYFLLFAISSKKENKQRAMVLSSVIVLVTIIMLALIQIEIIPQQYFVMIDIVTIIMCMLFFFPLSKPSIIKIIDTNEQVDERDTMFAREELKQGTDRYNSYYENNREFKEKDDKLKLLPELLSEGSHYYQAEQAQKIKDTFKQIKSLTTKVDGDITSPKTEIDLNKITAQLKNRILDMGASEVGVALLDKRYIYSHVGRGPEPYGEKIELNHKFVIVFTLEMDYNAVEQAPDLPITAEAAKKYLRGATISVDTAHYIRSLGYRARAHISDSNYQLILPPVASDAGLGELSRMGYLISQKFGPRIRLGAITTDIPLIVDKKRTFGVQNFCAVCLKCADNCPSAAIPTGDKVEVRGIEKWQLDIEQCIKYWRIAGTDCGLCMKVCPYSHPPTFVHNVIRQGLKNSPIARQLSIWGDDFFYGRKAQFK